MSATAVRLGPPAAAALVVATLAMAAAQLTWRFVVGDAGLPLGLVSAPVAAPDAGPPALGPILALAPFGEVAVETAPVAEAKATRLKLVLNGVVVAEPRARSVAYISGDGEAAKLFGVGDRVAQGATLAEVFRDHVVLDVSGAQEILAFPKADEDAAASAAAADIRGRIQAATGGARTMPAATSTPDEAVEFWRRRIAENPRAVLDQLGVAASQEGYRVGEEPNSAVRRAGFRTGDVIARVNGEPVGDVENDRKLYDRIAASGYARVELQRDGRTIVLSFPLH